MRAAQYTRDLPPLANVSVDIDGLQCYHQIHGLAAPADPVAMYTRALPRLLSLFDELQVRATLFVIGRDLEHPRAVEALQEARARGHEVASHSWAHPYNLRDWSKLSIAEDLDRSAEAIMHAVGTRPVGFRTPGYNVDTRILQLLAERGYRYDSSVLPSPAYYAAKGVVMGMMAAAGRPSRSSMTDPNALRAPLQPYRPSRWAFYQQGDRKHSLPIWEIPIGVTRATRLPVIGTSVGALHPRMVAPLYQLFKVGQRTLQFELHAIDLMDADDHEVHPDLPAHQPDLRRSWKKKRASIARMLQLMKGDYRMVTMAELAAELDAVAGPTVVT